MRVEGFKDPLPGLSPTPLPPLGSHLLQAAGVQLGFVDDLDGDLEMEERGKGQGATVPQAGKGSLIQTPRYVLPLSPFRNSALPGPFLVDGGWNRKAFAHAGLTMPRATLTSAGKYPLFHHGVWLGLLQGPVQSEGDQAPGGAPL